MKITLIIAFIGILMIAPIIIVGSRYFDGTIADNTYIRSLQYDQSRAVMGGSSIIWSEPECGSGSCIMTFSITPAPDNGSVSLRIFRPALGGDIEHTVYYDNDRWTVKFSPDSDGWYIHRLDYTLNGVMTGAESSFYHR